MSLSHRIALAGLVLLAASATAWAAPIVLNPGLEDTPTGFGGPGNYYSDIPHWDDPIGSPAGVALMPPHYTATWLNGLAAPEGTQVGFIQGGGTITQLVSGFEVGKQYILGYQENERRQVADAVARLQVNLDGTPIVPAHTVTRTAEFRQVISEPFTATSPWHEVQIVHPGGGRGDNTALFDNIIITTAGVDNASFEEGPDNGWPGYGPINGWTRIHPPGNSGNNDSSGPFVGGLPVPHGDRVAFIQGAGTIEQLVGGFEPGREYLVQYFENERTGVDRIARLQVDLGGQTIVPVHDVTRTPQFHTVVSEPFAATSFVHGLQFIHPGGGTGDNTALIDQVLITPADEPFIKNASFEDGPVHPWPGYGKINSWHSSGGEGLNDATGPFVNGLPIPDGDWVAFIQGSGSVSQTVVGLEPGQDYILQYSENERTGADRIARLQVDVDGATVVPVHDVTRTSRFRQVAGEPFTAASRSAFLEVIHPGGGTGDNTALFDAFLITPAGVPFIKNADFEQTPHGFGGSGDYYSDIPGWGDPIGNPAGVALGPPDRTATWLGGSPPAQGNQVGFIQSGGSIEQLVVGLEPGKDYILQYAENERGGTWSGPPLARLEVSLDGTPLVPVHDLTHTPEFRQVASAPFTATSHAALLTVTHPGGGTGDNTALFDDFIITEAGEVFVKNPSFEEGPDHAWPGYGHISRWSTTGTRGTNDATGPFLNGLPIPDGERIGFLQGSGSVSQLVVGFEPGEQYMLQYWENERGFAGGGAPMARLQVSLDGTPIVPVHDVTRTAAFQRVISSPFTAASHAQTLEIAHPGGGSGDNTAVFDDVVIRRIGDPFIYNPSFEKGPVNSWPGYGPINGWDRTHPPGNSGTNDASGPFLNGLPIPDGDWIGFIQGGGTISEPIIALEPGKKYTLTYFENERGYAGGGPPTAALQIDVDGATLVAAHDITRTDAFRRVVSAPFIASSYTALLEVIHPGGSGDNTALFDAFSVSRAVPVVPNGGFEAPAFGPGGFQYNPSGADWTFVGGAGINRNGGGFLDGPADNAPEGNQVAFIQGVSAVEQLVTGFEPGVEYSLGWAMKNRTNFGGINDLIVELIGPTGGTLELFNAIVDNPGWQYMASDPFQAAAGAYTVRFRTTNPFGGDNTTLIDDVHFNYVGGDIIPEPATLGLLALGGLGLLARRRRRR